MWCGRPNKSRHDGNGIACAQSTPRAALDFCSANRAENLCYQFGHGQKLMPQFRKIVGLVYSSGREHPHPKRKLIRSALINGMCLFKDGTRAARRRANRASDLRHTQTRFATITTSCNRMHFGLCAPFSHTPKTALSSFLLTHKFACF